ncbi:hypothetical protein MCOR27_005047 [Pyricularia oryzae]|uniref:Uncharacterized protein n=3 Tax=Pyricularia TaxID=48558 RepID=A0ABQ8NPU2_PYRGI|nr:hypothetical protein OOU_Y34scaffold00082g6 [Pyricularia oryzae Y34]KAI6265770.1 hypothetical protein MCOR26_010561 [Pyricularia oryzae]KAI6300155.1 hypothetical protein MCOR33_004047 [Pyricularia grisea]KAI6279583.1 hypothetical protein MCOR27_005047 [Pyricularia oryzae]KAI6336885.1 hypothetical protein MCOR30_003569 [Pyricularia oryzae]
MSRYASLFKMISFLSLLSDVIAYITEPKLLTINVKPSLLASRGGLTCDAA